MNQDITKYFTKGTSLCNIKTDSLSQCDQDIADALNLCETDENVMLNNELSDYYKGIIYFFAIGDLRDDDNGLYFLKREADNGNCNAMNLYGYAAYHVSRNCHEDIRKKYYLEKQAIKYFELAASENQEDALLNLGICFLEGKIVDSNKDKGIDLIQQAINLGNEKALKYMEKYIASKKTIPREESAECIYNKIAKEIVKEILLLPNGTKTNITGIYNDIYIDKGYQWIKHPSGKGWISTRDGGNTYNISDNELNTVLNTVCNLIKNENIDLISDEINSSNGAFIISK